MHRKHGDDRAALVARSDVGSVGHGTRTRTAKSRCAAGKATKKNAGLKRPALPARR
jgi:hypothetical protein